MLITSYHLLKGAQMSEGIIILTSVLSDKA